MLYLHVYFQVLITLENCKLFLNYCCDVRLRMGNVLMALFI